MVSLSSTISFLHSLSCTSLPPHRCEVRKTSPATPEMTGTFFYPSDPLTTCGDGPFPEVSLPPIWFPQVWALSLDYHLPQHLGGGGGVPEIQKVFNWFGCIDFYNQSAWRLKWTLWFPLIWTIWFRGELRWSQRLRLSGNWEISQI